MPTTLTADEVRRIASLARLELNEGEVDLFARQLSAILEYAAELQNVKSDDVPMAAGIVAAVGEDRLRDDVVRPSLPRAAVLDGAPGADRDAGFFTVPRVLGS